MTTSTVVLVAQAGSGLAVTNFTVTSGPGVISGLTNLTFTGTGNVSIVAAQAGNTNWNPAPNVTNTFGVGRANQTITFLPIPDQVVTSTVQLSATASSGLLVTFAVNSGPAVIKGGTLLSFTGTGTVGIAAGQAGNGNWNAAATVINTFNVTNNISPIVGVMNADFDGDRKADPATYDPANGMWHVKLSSAGYFQVDVALGIGGPGWTPAAADYDGDRMSDPAVYNEATGDWTVLLSVSGYLRQDYAAYLGGPNWAAASADFDGDGSADPSAYGRTTGTWIVMLSSAGYASVVEDSFLGGAEWNAVPGDYDGDGKADFAVRNSVGIGVWMFRLSSGGYAQINLPLGL